MLATPPTSDRVAAAAAPLEARSAEPLPKLQSVDLDLGLLFDRGLDAIVVAELETGLIAMWNPAAERLFGYAAHEVIGQPIEILMDGGVGAVHRAGLDRYRRTGHGLIMDSGRPAEVPARTKFGEDVRVELSLSPIQSRGGRQYILGVIRDVTDRKRVELLGFELARVQAARAQAETAAAAREEFISIAAQQLRAPAARLRGIRQQVLRQLQSHGRIDSEVVEQLAGALDQECDKLVRFGGALADVKLIDAGQLAVTPIDADLAHVVRRCVTAARGRSAVHRFVLRGVSEVKARFDVVRIEEVVLHLLDNAVKYNPEGCLIDVWVGNPAPDLAQVIVRDHGVGIAPERRVRLFERYYRVRPEIPPSGAGLGLYLSRHLVERHGGVLDAAFPPTGGMKVTATIPTGEIASPVSRRHRKPSGPTGKTDWT
jgi:PAS domain S-box-containing protein